MQYEYQELGQEVPSQWKLLPLHSKQKWATTSEKDIIHMDWGGGRRKGTVRVKARCGESNHKVRWLPQFYRKWD